MFNPRDDLWRGVVGKDGIEERNLAGEDFLQFCQCNQLSIIHEHLVSEETNPLWHLDASCHKTPLYD